tara:strand:- start:193 stop:453 length:261 start_codon:yes stop_codon:yes gene_type:complete
MLFKLAHRHDSPRTQTTNIARRMMPPVCILRNTNRCCSSKLFDNLLTLAANIEFDAKKERRKTESQNAEETGEEDDGFVMEVPLTH